MGLIGNLAFLNPWILAALAVLPVLWFLLRVTPPAPKRISFPATRFLIGLIPDQQTPSKTPWWLLLLRCLIAALIIIALARPVLNPSQNLPSGDNIRIVMETGWAAGQTWQTQIGKAEDLIRQAGRENKEITLVFTATAEQLGPLSETQALSSLRGLTPKPWPADLGALEDTLADPEDDVLTYWLGTGMKEKGFDDLAKTLSAQGNLIYVMPAPENLPLLLKPGSENSAGLSAEIDGPDTLAAGVPVSLQVLSENGQILDQRNITLGTKLSETVDMDIPEELRNKAASLKLAGRQSAGSTVLLDERFRKRDVGIVTSKSESETTPFIESEYYLTRALEPYADIKLAPIDELIEASPAVIIMPDIAALPPATLESLETWVSDGGLLLRFAGPVMSENESFLTPVPLRRGQRALEGDVTWEKPLKISPFPETSPLSDLVFSEDIIVRRQVLAEPVADLESKTWAELEDGTPFMTAAPKDKGMIVLVHSTASAAWSDFALSGLYVDVLRRIVSLSAGVNRTGATDQTLQPVLVMDGFGSLIQPKGVLPIPAGEFQNLVPSQDHPPGLYGRAGYAQALNLGERINMPRAVTSLPAGVQKQSYGVSSEKDLMPYLLSAALILFFIDWIVMMIMAAPFIFKRSAAAAALILFISLPAQAQERAKDIEYASAIHLAYIETGDSAIDRLSREGLAALGDVLAQRTSVEPEGVVAVNPENDGMAFFPFIYWPVTDNPRPLSEQALLNIQSYLNQGGTILFDTRDQRYTSGDTGGMVSTRNEAALRQMIGSLNIPPLSPISDDHVLGKSFYLLDSYPGRYDGGTLWVEERSASGRDGVSSVIIGGHDWAGAWAATQSGGSLTPRLSGGAYQQEIAYRFGVNLMMYALTGNYKDDQVHVPHILERLGQ